MENFIIRPYTKKELALLYFPHSNPRTAARHLMAWLIRCQPLLTALQSVGYRKSAKWFASREVRLIIEHLGDP